jgi:hypothetical protein
MEFAMLKHTAAMIVYPEQKILSYLGTRHYVPIMSSVDPPVSFMMSPKYVYVLKFLMLFPSALIGLVFLLLGLNILVLSVFI